MTKKINVLVIPFIFLFGFAGGAFLMILKDSKIIKQQKYQIEQLESGRDYDAMMLDIYHNKIFGNKDSIQ